MGKTTKKRTLLCLVRNTILERVEGQDTVQQNNVRTPAVLAVRAAIDFLGTGPTSEKIALETSPRCFIARKQPGGT